MCQICPKCLEETNELIEYDGEEMCEECAGYLDNEAALRDDALEHEEHEFED